MECLLGQLAIVSQKAMDGRIPDKTPTLEFSDETSIYGGRVSLHFPHCVKTRYLKKEQPQTAENSKRNSSNWYWSTLFYIQKVLNKNFEIDLRHFMNPYGESTGCLITDPSKVEAFYAHLGCNL